MMYRIFIVEDDEVIARTVKNHLEKWNYTVHCVENFDEVMEEFAAFDPQLVLMDIHLPFYSLTILEKQKPVDVVLTLDDRSVVQAGTCSKENRLHGADVYGIGNSTESVYYLDNGSVKCLVVPDEFGAGYQCMTQVVHKLNGDIRKMEDQTVQYTVIRRSELFSERNQELLFIMSQ